MLATFTVSALSPAMVRRRTAQEDVEVRYRQRSSADIASCHTGLWPA